MKRLIILPILLLAVCAFSQGARPPRPSGFNCYQCCPDFVTITITGNDLDSLHSDSLIAITPPPGYGIRLTKSPIMKTYHDGTPMTFASGQFVMLINEFGDNQGFGGYGLGELASWEDPFVTPYEGASTALHIWSHYITYNGQTTPVIPGVLDGSVYVWSSIPITGGGPNASIVITIWYEEIPYP